MGETAAEAEGPTKLVKAANKLWRPEEIIDLRILWKDVSFSIPDIARRFGVTPRALRNPYPRKMLGLGPRTKIGNMCKAGHYKVPDHCNPLVKQCFQIMNRERIPSKLLCKRAGMSPKFLIGMRKKNPMIHNFEAVLNVLGHKLTIVPMGRDE